MLSEFALSPAIFRTNSYESNGVADVCLGTLRMPLLEDCVVRNLHGGDWFQQLKEQRDTLHPKAKELLEKLRNQSRLVGHEPCDNECPRSDEGWENEALVSHERASLAGMIFSKDAKVNRHRENRLVACPEKLSSSDFWKERSCSLRIPRTINDYCNLLLPLLRHATGIAFIDPHLDPKQDRYKDFLRLFTHPALTGRGCKPAIEIHRVAWLGDGKDKRSRSSEIESIFKEEWATQIANCGMKIKVFLWDDFHDRFVHSNLLSMNWSNGFDTTTDSSARVTVSRLSRVDRDDLQKEFAENSTSHNLLKMFVV